MHDIRTKGAARNYSTRPNEKLHGPLKEAYQNSNGRDFAQQVHATAPSLFVPIKCYHDIQILRMDHNKLAIKLLRSRIDGLEEYKQQVEDTREDNKDSDAGAQSCNAPSSIANAHIKLGSPCKIEKIQEVEATHTSKDRAFEGFRRKLTEYINQSLPSYGYALTQWFAVPPQFEVSHLYPYFMISTSSLTLSLATIDSRIQVSTCQL